VLSRRKHDRYSPKGVAMSAIGPKQTWASALHLSTFGGNADMTIAPRNA
jgi:hypothetical protein